MNFFHLSKDLLSRFDDPNKIVSHVEEWCLLVFEVQNEMHLAFDLELEFQSGGKIMHGRSMQN
jgi:hypothetical protein